MLYVRLPVLDCVAQISRQLFGADIDGIDINGTIRTGPAQICGQGANCDTTLPMPPASTPHAAQRYAYSATVVGMNYLRHCPAECGSHPDQTPICRAFRAELMCLGAVPNFVDTCAGACTQGMAQVKALRQANPLTVWNDFEHGRTASAPKNWHRQ